MAGIEVRRFERSDLKNDDEAKRSVLVIRPYVDRWEVVWRLVAGDRELARREYRTWADAHRLFVGFNGTPASWEWLKDSEGAGWWRAETTDMPLASAGNP